MPWHQRLPGLRALLRDVFARAPTWHHDPHGRYERAPRLTAGEASAHLTAAQLHDLKRLAFVQEPPAMLDPAMLEEQQAALYECLEVPRFDRTG